MGTSPREEAAERFANIALYLAGRRGQLGIEGAREQYREFTPLFEKAEQDVRAFGQYSSDLLNRILSAQLTNIGSQVGEGLISSNVAVGAPRAEALVAAYAPAIAATQGAQANLAGNIMQLLSTQNLARIGTLSDLLKMNEQQLTNLLQLHLGGVERMKATSTLGDVLGVLNTIANIVSSIRGKPS